MEDKPSVTVTLVRIGTWDCPACDEHNQCSDKPGEVVGCDYCGTKFNVMEVVEQTLGGTRDG